MCIWCQRTRSDFNVINMVSMVTHRKTWSNRMALHEVHKSNGAFHQTEESTSSDQSIVHWRIGGVALGKHTPGPIFSLLCGFWEKISTKLCWRPLLGWRPFPVWEMLDQPLESDGLSEKLSNTLSSPPCIMGKNVAEP